MQAANCRSAQARLGTAETAGAQTREGKGRRGGRHAGTRERGEAGGEERRRAGTRRHLRAQFLQQGVQLLHPNLACRQQRTASVYYDWYRKTGATARTATALTPGAQNVQPNAKGTTATATAASASASAHRRRTRPASGRSRPRRRVRAPRGDCRRATATATTTRHTTSSSGQQAWALCQAHCHPAARGGRLLSLREGGLLGGKGPNHIIPLRQAARGVVYALCVCLAKASRSRAHSCAISSRDCSLIIMLQSPAVGVPDD